MADTDQPSPLSCAAAVVQPVVQPVVEAVIERLRRLQEKFSRLRDGQVIELEPVDPSVPIKVRPAKRRGHHGIVTSGAKVNYTKETV